MASSVDDIFVRTGPSPEGPENAFRRPSNAVTPAALRPSVAAGDVHSIGEIGLQQFAPYLMNRIMGRYNATVREALRAQGLTTAQMRALAVLTAVNGLTVNDLAVYSVIEQSTLSRTLDTMEKNGWVRREPHHSDSRVRLICLTSKGRDLFDAMWPTMWEAFSVMFNGVDDAEYATFLSVLHRMLKNIRHHEF